MGQVDVFPIKLNQFNEMCRICLVNRDKAEEGSYEKRMWWRNYVILILGVNTGARISTLLRLRPIDIAGGHVKIYETKTHKTFKYEINERVYGVVREYINEYGISDYEYIFTGKRSGKTGKPLTRQQCRTMILQLAKMVGIDYKVGCHSLRKSYGRYEYDKSKDLPKVQRLLGHESPIVTLQYICLEDEKVDKARKASSWGIID